MSVRDRLVAVVAVGVTMASLPVAAGANRPLINYRNDGSGVYRDAKPPLTWNASAAAPANALWRTPLPGPAESSQPVIGGDFIYVQSVPFTLTCLDKLTGKVLWQRQRHADDKAAGDSEEEKAARLERYVLFCEREIIGRFGSMKAAKPGRPLSTEERYRLAISFRGAGAARDDLDANKVESELAEIRRRIPETWPGSNAEVALADNDGYKTRYTGIASPATNGEAVYAHFATGVVVAYDRDGRRLWLRLLTGDDGNLGDSGVSYQAVTPLLHQGRLYVQRFIGPGDAKKRRQCNLHCLDATTGKTLWIKPMGRGGYTGPLALQREGVPYIITPDGVFFRPDGTRLAGKYGAFFDAGGNAGPSPAIDRATGTVYLSAGVRLPDAKGTTPTVLWQLTGRGTPHQAENWLAQHVPEGERPAPRSQTAVWKAREAAAPKGQQGKRGSVRNLTSPVVRDGILYFLNSAFKVLSASDVSKDALEEMYYAEPVPFAEVKSKPRGSQAEVPFVYTDLTIAGDYLFVHGWTETAIVKAGRKFQVVAVNPHEPSMSNLVFDGDRMYLRGLRHLWCIGGPADGKPPAAEQPLAAPHRTSGRRLFVDREAEAAPGQIRSEREME